MTASEWKRHPEAEAFIGRLLAGARRAMPSLDRIAGEIDARTGTRWIDWIDHVAIEDGPAVRAELAALGFVAAAPEEAEGVWSHPGALFPKLVLRRSGAGGGGGFLAAALGVEEVQTFLAVRGIEAPIEGPALGPLRRARIAKDDGLELWAVERRGHAGVVPPERPAGWTSRVLRASEAWRARPMRGEDAASGSSAGHADASPRGANALPADATLAAMQSALELAGSLAGDLGADEAAWTVFAVERERWQGRNRAGRAQKARQDALGLGWANHDHHTFRSSRFAFPLLIRILETLGFRSRERFHAGAQAGWGAQVLEQPTCRIAVFADVDLSPEEVAEDFAHGELVPREELGTVGLWCALHGESMLAAGLHHLAVRSDFDALTRGLADWGVAMLSPFSDFSFLRQAFTRGERWVVDPERVEAAAASSKIDEAARRRFLESGAIGSHLENIQRAEGFKGFNQAAVSDIIRRTDPRGRGA